MFPSILSLFSNGGSSANSAITLNGSTSSETESKEAANKSANEELIAEWVINSDHIVSAIYTATASQAAFPQDIVNLVTEYLQNHEALQHLSIFGPSDWTTTFNKKVEVIEPPPEMDAFLQRKNPFTRKLNAESCLCVFIPSHYQNILPNQDTALAPNMKEEQEVANNHPVPLTPATMEELAKNPVNPENQSKFEHFLNDANRYYYTSKDFKKVRNKLLHLQSEKSYWVVITPDIIPGSRNQSYSKQQKLINKKGIKEHWHVPSIREAIICAFAHYAKTGVRIPNNNPVTYTMCIEQIDGYQTVVGNFTAMGLEINYQIASANDLSGVIVLRKFAF